MHVPSAILLPLLLSFASPICARAIPDTASNTASNTAASAVPSPTAPTPGDFKLYTITYDPEYNTDADAAEKFNNSYIGYFNNNGINSLVGNVNPSNAPIWTLDPSTHALTALAGSPVGPVGAVFLSNITNTGSMSLQDAIGYSQTILDTSNESPSHFATEPNYPDASGSIITYQESIGDTLIFGSFVICEALISADVVSYTLLWRGSSKAVWKTPAGCALVKLGLDYEL